MNPQCHNVRVAPDYEPRNNLPAVHGSVPNGASELVLSAFFVMAKEIPLKNSDQKFLCDDADYVALIELKWSIDSNGYVKATINGKSTFVHRHLLGVTDPKIFVDHKDFNPLNNQRYNIRKATPAQNVYHNRKIPGRGESQYKGVCKRFDRKRGTWRATIRFQRKGIDLGMFATEYDAARAYDFAAVKYFGEFAELNFSAEHLQLPPPVPVGFAFLRKHKYFGIGFNERDKRWVGRIFNRAAKRFVHLGYFKTDIEAAVAYDIGQRELYGTNATNLNFQSGYPVSFPEEAISKIKQKVTPVKNGWQIWGRP